MPVAPASPIETTRGDRKGVLQACIQTMAPDPDLEGPGRPRILPALALWAGLWVCVLRDFKSQLALWRLLCKQGTVDGWICRRLLIADHWTKDAYRPV